MVLGDDSCSKGCGFESRGHILDVHLDLFHIDLLLKLYLFEKTENKRKRGRGWAILLITFSNRK